MYTQRTIEWDDNSNSIVMIDQTLLPKEFKFVRCVTLPDVIDAIKSMKIRGAPAIGVAGAMGVALAVQRVNQSQKGTCCVRLNPMSWL